MSKVADVLAELRLEEERLTVELGRIRRAIEALEESMNPRSVAAEAAPEQPAPLPAPPGPPAAPYANLNLYQAARAYLDSVKSPQTSQQIARALVEGGFRTDSARFTSTVRTMLRRPTARRTGISVTRDEKRFFIRKKK